MPSIFPRVWRTGIVTEPLATLNNDDELVMILAEINQKTSKLLRRSLNIRQIDAGSCNGCEIEISALTNPYYDLERFGMHFVASPRHADCLLVTGPVTRNMAGPLKEAYAATPAPKFVIAVGECAIDAGIFASAYAVVGGVAKIIPVDIVINGCPPPPKAILKALLQAVDRLA